MKGFRKFLFNNGLSIVFTLLFLITLYGQYITGFHEHNKERREDGQVALNHSEYFHSGHFIQATFENWESEFFQMALFIVLTIFLKQRGSSESKSFEGDEEVDREPDPAKSNAPWPIRKGGWVLRIYKHSLTIAFFILFIGSFVAHFYGSFKDENEQLASHGSKLQTVQEFILDSRFWFESFQNWQSEFLSILSIVLLSIYLRQKGSPQSKPVDAPHLKTGD